MDAFRQTITVLAEKVMRFFGFQTVDDEGEDIQQFVFSFKITGDDIEEYSNYLMKRIFGIPAFQQRVNKNEIEVMKVQNGRLIFITVQSGNDMMNDPAINAVFRLFEEEERVSKIKMNMKDPDETWAIQKVIELVFKTKGKDIEMRHGELYEKIMNVPGFKEKVLRYDAEIISNKKGKMKFILKQSDDADMEDPAIKAVLELMEKEDKVKKIQMDVIEKRMPELGDNEEEKQNECYDLLKLEFNTKGQVIQVYHKELFEKIMDLPGFYEKVYDYKKKIISDQTGKMTFILKQSPDTAMDDPAMKAVLHLLKENDGVSEINMDDKNVPSSVPMTEIKPKQPKLTQAIMISFIAKGENVKEFADELMKEFEEIEYFKYKMYEKVITIMRKDKAKFQFVMYHSGAEAMKDPDMLSAIEIIRAKERTKKLKVETIPYFTE